MPMHDWGRVESGVYHDFHTACITQLRNALNDGLPPKDFYALGEQRAGDYVPGVLTLKTTDSTGVEYIPEGGGSEPVAIAEAPPKVSLTQEATQNANHYLGKQRQIAIRHVTGDRVVALIEIVSPENKHSQRSVDEFVHKVASAIEDGVHVMVIDLFAPGTFDPKGMHGAVWFNFFGENYEPPAGRPLTLVLYLASQQKAYVEPYAIGSSLIDMPLFLTRDHYIPVPLESTYKMAYRGVPMRWKSVIEGTHPG